MPDLLYDTATLQGVVRALPVPRLGFAAKFFTRVVESDDAEIRFDVEGTDLRMAPFVSPLVPGKLLGDVGFSTKTFRPAYTKDKAIFTPQRSLTRRLGEQIGGEYSPEERLALSIATELANKLDRLERRLEWMATQALLHGKVTVVGEQYPAKVVDFGRSPGNTVVKSGAALWGASGVSPLADIVGWSEAADTPITDWFMTPDAYAVFRASADVKAEMQLVRGESSIKADAVLSRDLMLMGVIAGLRIWVIPRLKVTHEDGTTALMVPAGTVIGIADAYFEGVRHFGAIQDVEHLVPGAYFAKSWIEPDPSARYLMVQSAPLMVPYRPDASFRATVL